MQEAEVLAYAAFGNPDRNNKEASNLSPCYYNKENTRFHAAPGSAP